MTNDHPPPYIIETARTRLRPMHVSDADGIYRLNLHPDILRFTTDPPFESVDAARAFLESYDPYSKYGMGRWTVLLKTTGEYMGWCGLKYLPESNEVDVGYRFLPEFWGQGYATETAIACCEWGHEVKKLNRIIACVHHENFKSMRVAEKLGMTYEKDVYHQGEPWKNYVREWGEKMENGN